MAEKTSQVLIIGGGAAGISAAIWCADLGLTATLVERSEIGGQLHWIHNRITNYPGVVAENGKVLNDRFRSSLDSYSINAHRAEIRRFAALDLSCIDADGSKLSADAIIIATGIRRRTLDVPGEQSFVGRGILGSGSRDRKEVAGKRVVVIGGGDAAAENALILAEYADHVHLIHRGSSLSARDEFRTAVEGHDRIEIILSTHIRAFYGQEHLETIELSNRQSIDIDHAVIRVGVEPNSDRFAGQIELDDRGYLLVDGECRTSAEMVYAIGDVANPVAPTIATAVGMAATAVKSIAKQLRK